MQGFSLAPTFYPGTVSPADAERITVGAGEERRADFSISPVRAGVIDGLRETGEETAEAMAELVKNFAPAERGRTPQ